LTPDDVDPAEVTLAVTAALEELGVPYFVCGSLASIIHGLVRTTNDVDIVADLRPATVAPLVRALAADFFVDQAAVARAVRERGSFNLLSEPMMFKVDVFMPRGTPFEQAQFGRRRRMVLGADPDRAAFVASAEDTVLAKLDWYRKGNQVSERQWSDVLGILRTQGSRLDLDYLRHWAATLSLNVLLEQAFEAAEG
jgi:hypothetical protein